VARERRVASRRGIVRMAAIICLSGWGIGASTDWPVGRWWLDSHISEARCGAPGWWSEMKAVDNPPFPMKPERMGHPGLWGVRGG
jgi:hypothetical protein